jgi:hypothetical protein
MIDISSEDVFPLNQAPRHLPKRRKGKRAAISTPYRWAQRGLRGVRLETIQVGNTKCTSLQALQRFFDRLTEVAGSSPSSPSECQRDAEAAEAELASEGL